MGPGEPNCCSIQNSRSGQELFEHSSAAGPYTKQAREAGRYIVALQSSSSHSGLWGAFIRVAVSVPETVAWQSFKLAAARNSQISLACRPADTNVEIRSRLRDTQSLKSQRGFRSGGLPGLNRAQLSRHRFVPARVERNLQRLGSKVKERWRHKHSASPLHGSCPWLSASSAFVAGISFGA